MRGVRGQNTPDPWEFTPWEVQVQVLLESPTREAYHQGVLRDRLCSYAHDSRNVRMPQLHSVSHFSHCLRATVHLKSAAQGLRVISLQETGQAMLNEARHMQQLHKCFCADKVYEK